MSLLARNARAVARNASKARSYSVVVDAPSSEWVAKRKAVKVHAGGALSTAASPVFIIVDTLFSRNRPIVEEDQVRNTRTLNMPARD